MNDEPLSDGAVADIAAAAVTGIAYWSTIVTDIDADSWSQAQPLPEQFPFFTVVEDGGEGPVSITPAIIRLGWQRVLSSDRKAWGDHDFAAPPSASVIADIVVQFGLFGGIVYS